MAERSDNKLGALIGIKLGSNKALSSLYPKFLNHNGGPGSRAGLFLRACAPSWVEVKSPLWRFLHHELEREEIEREEIEREEIEQGVDE